MIIYIVKQYYILFLKVEEQCSLISSSAVGLSYLSEEEQKLVDEVLTTTGYRLSMSEAEELRAAKRPLTRDVVYQIIEDSTTRAAAAFKLDWSFIERYFKPEQSRDEIEGIIAKALDMYFG